jgi:hypothetical protein
MKIIRILLSALTVLLFAAYIDVIDPDNRTPLPITAEEQRTAEEQPALRKMGVEPKQSFPASKRPSRKIKQRTV